MSGVDGSVLLEVRDLALGDDPAFRLALRGGELVAVSGWDSSELLWAIAGLGGAGAGTVLVDGQPIADHDRAAAAGVALIAQGGALAMLLTAYENVLLPLLALDRARVDDPVAAARRALELVGLADSADHLVEELSGGQRQRVAIARAISARPRVLLADQVTTDLDPANRASVMSLLRELTVTGSGVLLASDDPAVIEACDRALTL